MSHSEKPLNGPRVTTLRGQGLDAVLDEVHDRCLWDHDIVFDRKARVWAVPVSDTPGGPPRSMIIVTDVVSAELCDEAHIGGYMIEDITVHEDRRSLVVRCCEPLRITLTLDYAFHLIVARL